MHDKMINLPHAIYFRHLKVINDVKFTQREIDIIACLLSGRAVKKIASYLSIAPKTVETHTRNIMLKLDRNSREGIIDFIEKTGKFSILKEYYVALQTQALFEKQLRHISTSIQEVVPSCLIVYQKKYNSDSFPLNLFETHLNLAGIKTSIKRLEDLKEAKEHNGSYLTCLVLNSTSALSTNFKGSDSSYSLAMQKLKFLNFVLINQENDVNKITDSNEDDQINTLNINDHYTSIFTILKKIIVSPNLDRFISEFYEQGSILGESSNKTSVQLPSKTDLDYQKNHKNIENEIASHKIRTHDEIPIRSDLIIPADSTLLIRDELLSQINKALNNQDEIQTLALVGIGGAGKTTIARLYAREQTYSLVWEINSETQECIISSFENLAYALSQTEDEKKILRGLTEISNPKDKEDKIILFVREKLRPQSNWFLIYDNVEKFSDIQKYFPFDTKTWGIGKIIITSRDSNIQYNSHINKAISVSELDITEKLTLFNNIISNEQAEHFSKDQTDQIETFLSYIPPFPLDVSIAAYYLKTTNISYKNYIEHVKGYSIDLDNLQQDIIKEATQYEQTRYNIITLSIDCMLKTNEKFEGLLLFVSLIDSQNIAKEMLSYFKNEIIVDSFIYHLKKYSLTICTPSDDFRSNPSFTIHRSTQEISLNYLIKKQMSHQKKQYIEQIIHSLEKYLISIIDKEDYSMMKILKSHCERFLHHSDIIPLILQSSLHGILGSIHYHLGNYEKAQQLLTGHINTLKQQKSKVSDCLAWMLT